MYANVPLVTQLTSELPEQSNRQEIFSFIETELNELSSILQIPDPMNMEGLIK